MATSRARNEHFRQGTVPDESSHRFQTKEDGSSWSVRPTQHGQGELFAGEDYESEHVYLPRWDDLTPKTQASTIAKNAAEGVTLESMVTNIRGLVERHAERDVDSLKNSQKFYTHEYPGEARGLADEGGLRYEQGVDVISANSPQVNWIDNPSVAAASVSAHAAAREGRSPEVIKAARSRRPTGLEANVVKGEEMLGEGLTLFDVTKGKKTQSFAQNARTPNHPLNRPTIDVHAVRGAMGDNPKYTSPPDADKTELGRSKKERDDWIGRVGNYELAAHAHSLVGEQLGMSGEEVQAAAWYQHKYENEQLEGHHGSMARRVSLEGGGMGTTGVNAPQKESLFSKSGAPSQAARPRSGEGRFPSPEFPSFLPPRAKRAV